MVRSAAGSLLRERELVHERELARLAPPTQRELAPPPTPQRPATSAVALHGHQRSRDLRVSSARSTEDMRAARSPSAVFEGHRHQRCSRATSATSAQDLTAVRSPSALRRYRAAERPSWPTAHARARLAHPSATQGSARLARRFDETPRWRGQDYRQQPPEWTPRNGQDPYAQHAARVYDKLASHPSYREADPPQSHRGGWDFVRPDLLALPSARDDWLPPRPGDWYEA